MFVIGAFATSITLSTASSGKVRRIAIVHSGCVLEGIDLNEGNHIMRLLRSEFPADKFKIRSYYIKSNLKSKHDDIVIGSDRLATKVKTFNPDLIITFGDEAFDHLAVPHFSKSQAKIFFFCLSSWEYKKLYDANKVPLNAYGAVARPSFNKVLSNLKLNGYSDKNLYILTDGGADTQEGIEFLKAELPKNTIETYEIKNDAQLKKTLLDLAGKPQGILVSMLRSVKTNTGIIYGATMYKVITSYNKKHFEVSVGSNATVWGFGAAISCVHSVIDTCPSASAFKMIINGETPKERITFNDNAVTANHKRIDELHFDDFMNGVEYIDTVLDL